MAEGSIAVDPDLYAVDDHNNAPDDWRSETTSIGSSIYRGLMENGRRYQTLRNKDYLIPADERQWEAYEAGHLVSLIMESDTDNPFFRAPLGPSPTHILDIGTGRGTWAIDVADLYPNTTVRGVDLFPPPVAWMPPNCVLEVDDVQQDWTWHEQFDLIHMRIMIGSFDDPEWDILYKQCYDKIRPGGWIEQLEVSPVIETDDGSLPPDNILNDWGPNMLACGQRAGRGIDTFDKMGARIRKAGFVNLHQKDYKWPIGPWPKDRQLKEAGMVNYQHWTSGMEGWCMWLLTRHGAPHPWSQEEVQVYVARLRAELIKPRFHIWHKGRRVWAQKPFSETPERK
ncbi:hypothetical protein N7462_001776 [Penicillium macrosclerotiorum]|uniref:uncharacterized protein n=1 Tax=Penicillium macrosclerotiorum TaxID=303699 RepID=UPI00254769C1|nr:uncharacterized protein N7462_001776 [Penicillium macrosclerotiorum]KAJ5692353.1 hypothetical protein N7462_001776 [Penicillium macrosclerotiorum]